MEQRSDFDGSCVDYVVCIDVTGRMAPLLPEVKKLVLSFRERVEKLIEERFYEGLVQVRIKVIAFRDYKYDKEAMVESPFFLLPNQKWKFINYLFNLEAKGGDGGPANALEAIALALKSDWTTCGRRRRHVILVFTDAPALPLGERADCPSYPAGMPKDLAELGAWWEDGNPSFCGSYRPSEGYLIAFAPTCSPWIEMQMWNRYWPVFSHAGTESVELDIQCALDLLFGS